MTRTLALALLASLVATSTVAAHPRSGRSHRDRDHRHDRHDRRDRHDRHDRHDRAGYQGRGGYQGDVDDDDDQREDGDRGWYGGAGSWVVDFGSARAVGDACRSAMVGQASEQRCVTLASQWRGGSDPAATIRACERAMVGDTDTLACIGTMSRSWLPAAAVDAYEQAMVGNTDTIACLDALIGTRYEPRQLVSYCAQETVGDAAAIECIRSWR